MIKQHWGYFIFLFFYSITHAQVVNSGDIDYTKVAVRSEYLRTGYVPKYDYESNTQYKLVFGVEPDGITLSKVPVLKSFKYNNLEYIPFLKGLTPYDNIKIARKDNTIVTSKTKFTGFLSIVPLHL
ncbi:hypothetical protein [Empedobacter falsenii]|uniref:Uncharacterized protein n=1 Tax=Empedobacter falsenii TaxID=343874 RepID=A0A376FYU3_9FLAO|nr:hypothetical protein [Empedobacter falsenii]STD52831.1 Uncharacterised protein [Empedobacter falsenii]